MPAAPPLFADTRRASAGTRDPHRHSAAGPPWPAPPLSHGVEQREGQRAAPPRREFDDRLGRSLSPFRSTLPVQGIGISPTSKYIAGFGWKGFGRSVSPRPS